MVQISRANFLSNHLAKGDGGLHPDDLDVASCKSDHICKRVRACERVLGDYMTS